MQIERAALQLTYASSPQLPSAALLASCGLSLANIKLPSSAAFSRVRSHLNAYIIVLSRGGGVAGRALFLVLFLFRPRLVGYSRGDCVLAGARFIRRSAAIC